jgi:polyphosphate glucokinase
VATLGIDIGGSGIKAALVDTRRGTLTTERVRVKTPQPAKRDAVMEQVATLVEQLGGTGPIGITFPGVVMSGTVRTAVNLHPSWVGVELPVLVKERTGRDAVAVNDADAAGLAEVTYGAAKAVKGLVMMLTFGTGVGSALITDGTLVANTELGHLEFQGKDAESVVSESARERNGWSWKKWAKLANDYLAMLERLFSPDLFVIGGGIAKKPDAFAPLLETTAPLRIAALGNNAGIVGAARLAQRSQAATRRRTRTAAASA